MADYSTYPGVADIRLLLKSNGAWPADSETTAIALANEQAEIAVRGAISEFEEKVGWYPFLAGGSATARTFDGTSQNGVLELDGGIISSPAPVVTVSGTTYTANTQYWLGPRNAESRGKPYTHIQFAGSFYSWPGLPGFISVTAKWGFCTTVPVFVWKNIQEYAGVKTLMAIRNESNIGSLSQDGFSKSYDVVGVIDPKTILATWGKDFAKNFMPYIRVVV